MGIVALTCVLACMLFSMGNIGAIVHSVQAAGNGTKVVTHSGGAQQFVSSCGPYGVPCPPTPTSTPVATGTPVSSCGPYGVPCPPTPTSTPVATNTPVPSPTNTPPPNGTTIVAVGNVDPAGGVVSGTMSTGNFISVSFPPGAVSTVVTVTIATFDTPPVAPPDNDAVVGLDFDLSAVDGSGNAIDTFNGEAVTITFGYPAGSDPTLMKYAFFDTTTQSWQPLTVVNIDTVNLLIQATTTHFTTFSVVALPTAPYCAEASHTDPFRGTGDINGDGKIDQFDLSIFSQDWLKSTGDPTLHSPYSDMNCSTNKTIDQFDLSIFSQDWLK